MRFMFGLLALLLRWRGAQRGALAEWGSRIGQILRSKRCEGGQDALDDGRFVALSGSKYMTLPVRRSRMVSSECCAWGFCVGSGSRG